MSVHKGNYLSNIDYDYFSWIVENELRMIGYCDADRKTISSNMHYFIGVAKRILEVARNNTVLRSGNIIAGMTIESVAFESVGGHTNLMNAIINDCLNFVQNVLGSSVKCERHLMNEAAMAHDLAENIFGDIPDVRTRDNEKKRNNEREYYRGFWTFYDERDHGEVSMVRKLLNEMEAKSSFEGRILYLADKISAIIMMLCYDYQGLYPSVSREDSYLENVKLDEIELCEMLASIDKVLLSELWTVDFLYGRKMSNYDDTGFFVALLVTETMMIHGDWYGWREQCYLQ